MAITMRNDGTTNASPTAVGPDHAMFEIPKGDGKLRCQRPRHDLGQGHGEAVFLLGHPVARLHEIAMHESSERDRAAKA
jgi:hypothetical protein